MHKFVTKSVQFLSSTKFFLIVVGLLVFQAAWFALTAIYPMAFDEQYHFGLIQLYAQQWSPFFASQPIDSAAFGDLVRNSSYLFHYLLSFPYRLIDLFIHQEIAQIIILRFVNIGIFTAGLFVFRQLLLRVKVSPAITHLSLLMLVLIPVVPFLAGQINYDNLLFLLIPAVILFAYNCGVGIQKTGTLPPVSLALLLIFCFLASLVKYAFLPIFLALGLYLVIMLFVHKRWRVFFKSTITAFRRLGLWLKIGLVVGLIVSAGLFIERYGINIASYHKLQPDCAQLMSIDECKKNGPWNRNYNIKINNQNKEVVPLNPSQAMFMPAWVDGMMHRLYFAINYNYSNYPQLPVIYFTAYIVGFIGLVLSLVFSRRLFKANPALVLLALVAVVYTASVLYINYSGYLNYRKMQAINGRYLILILPLFFAIAASSYSIFINKISKKWAQSYKLLLLTVVLLLTLQGAGLLTYLVRSDPSWYWSNPMVQNVNTTAHNALRPIMIGGYDYN